MQEAEPEDERDKVFYWKTNRKINNDLQSPKMHNVAAHEKRIVSAEKPKYSQQLITPSQQRATQTTSALLH